MRLSTYFLLHRHLSATPSSFSGRNFNFYRPQTKFPKVMFSHVFVCSWGGGFCIQGEGLHPGGLHPGRGLHLGGGSASGGFCIQGRGLHPRRFCIQGGLPNLLDEDSPQSDTMGYDQRAGGMHPTGMHSC